MDAWTLTYNGFDPSQERLREALCTLGNGYFATRGSAPESVDDRTHYPGTYVAGLYNRLTTNIDGRRVENEDMVNVPNWLSLTFRIEDGPWFSIDSVDIVDILEYRQELDVRHGVLFRRTHFRDSRGRETSLAQRRFVSMASPHLAGLETTIVAENWSGKLEVCSALDGRVVNAGVDRYRELNGVHLRAIDAGVVEGGGLFLVSQTNQSLIRMALACRTETLLNEEPLHVQRETRVEEAYAREHLFFTVAQGDTVTVEKAAALYTSRDRAVSECAEAARTAIKRGPRFVDLLERHTLAWDQLWTQCDIAIEDDQTTFALRFQIFHLLQTVSEHTTDLDVGVPARGLHGEAYRGHIFWDELFIFPLLNLRVPQITRALLEYRYRRLPEARRAAHEAGFSGVMFPWQSGSTGREETQRLHLNPRSGRWLEDQSHLQRHINSAIAYNIWQYYQVTGDVDFMWFYGAEMFLEIARFWASASTYNRVLDRYEITGVMGPDEYHDALLSAEKPGLDNNTYTNVMAVWVLWRALEVLELLSDDRAEALREWLGLSREELTRWDDISHKMRVIFHEDGVISQFEGYEGLQEFDWEGYRNRYGDIQRLDRILESEGDTPNRYKVSKQADVLMLFYLFSSDELRELFARLGYPFGYETIPRNVEYYIQRTSNGSTLSRVVSSWVLARAQRHESWEYFQTALGSDLTDIQGGTTSEGIHLGAMAGSVDLVQRCFLGLETRGGVLTLNPSLPYHLRGMALHLRYRRHWLDIRVSDGTLRVSSPLSDATPITVAFKEARFDLDAGKTLEFPLEAPRGSGAPPTDGPPPRSS